MPAGATRSHVQARSSRLIGRTVTVDHDGSCPAQFGTVNRYALRKDQPAGRAPSPAGEDARLGLSHRQIAFEFGRRYGLRPRAAWRHACGWSLTEAAEQINAYAARAGLMPRGNTVAMTGPHLCETENWPGPGTKPAGRRPTPYLLALLAAAYSTPSVHDLLDMADYEHMPAADRLILDKSTGTSGQHEAPAADRKGTVALDRGGAVHILAASLQSLPATRPVPPTHAPPAASDGAVAPELAPLAAALLSAPGSNEIHVGHLAEQALHAWKLRQACRYRKLAGDLPQALVEARNAPVGPGEDRHLSGLAALTHLYNTASSLAARLGSPELAGIAADRAVQAADGSGDPLLRGAAAYRLANVLMAAGQHGPARAIAIGAADRLRPVMTASRSHTAMWGALLATAALAAARARAAAEAWELLGGSKVAADQLGTEHADLFSIFGSANWLIHAVNVAADLGNGTEAVRRAERVPAGQLPAFLAERRTFLLLGKARGHALCNDVTAATTVLLDAEQAAPEEVRHNSAARSLISDLLAGGPVRNEQLRGLAARMSDASNETATGMQQ